MVTSFAGAEKVAACSSPRETSSSSTRTRSSPAPRRSEPRTAPSEVRTAVTTHGAVHVAT